MDQLIPAQPAKDGRDVRRAASTYHQVRAGVGLAGRGLDLKAGVAVALCQGADTTDDR
ncbi:hypothetical protein D3C72_1413600 [compost metagenome]